MKKKVAKRAKRTWGKGKIMRETCNFDLFYDLWDRPQPGEINSRDGLGTARNLASSLFGKPV